MLKKYALPEIGATPVEKVERGDLIELLEGIATGKGNPRGPASDKRRVDNFRTDSLRELMKIKAAWAGLQYRIERGRRGEKNGGLVLLPSTPQIRPLTLVPQLAMRSFT